LIRHPAETVVIGKPHPMNSIAGIIGGIFKGAKIILDCDDYEAASNYFSSKWQQIVVKLFENITPRFVNQITTNTLYNKERMISLGIPSKKIYYLPNGVDKDRFKKIDNSITAKISNKLDLSNKKIIAYIGSLNLSNHPVDLLINAFKQITEKLNNVILIIVGGGRDIYILKRLVDNLELRDKVFFEGRVPPATVPNYYDLADVTVDPVYDEDSAKGRCPLKMFESWLMRTPFVTSDVGDRRYLSGYSNIQLLAKPGDPDDLASKIIKIIIDPKLKELIIQEGSEKVKNYSWHALIIDNLDIFTF
jgi:glycosyltransferase involved in cell wall biosynthesis